MPRARSVASALRLRPSILLAIALVATGCASSAPRAGRGDVERGVASWYGPGFHGRDTASGEVFDTQALTAAHRSLPFGTLVEVRNLDNGLTTTVRVNDRGPFAKNRKIDLSRAAAEAIGMIGPGTARVELRIVGSVKSDRRWTVQLGAFRERGLADGVLERLGSAYPGAVVRSDATWHRVQVGDFADRGEADALRRKLQRAGFSAVVVPAQRTGESASSPAG